MKTGRPPAEDHRLAAWTRRGRRPDRCRPHAAWATVVILACASLSRAQTAPRQVLLLYSYERDVASHNAFATMFRPELSRLFGEPIDFIEVSLQAARLNPSASEESILNEVESTLPRRGLDLVVPIGGPAAVFAQTYRQQLFPTTPMLLAGVDRRFVQNGALGANDTAVAVEHDPSQMIDAILRLLPDTRTVFVVIGASPFEQFWLKEMRAGLRRFEGRLRFIWTDELSFEEMLKGCASLPSHSAIFYGVLSSDAKGVRQAEERTLGAFHAAANAPIFGLHSTQLGRGIVGGPLLSIEDLSRNTATVAVRMLRGESSHNLTTPTQGATTPTFDARELRRWGIGEDRLLPGSVVLFREPTAWQRYRPPMLAGVTVASAQAVFVIALVVSLVKRRRVERSLRVSEESSKLASVALSGLSRRLLQSHEQERAWVAWKLNEEFCQRLTGLNLQLHSLSMGSRDNVNQMRARVEELSAQLGDLTSEIQAISDQSYHTLELLGLVASVRTFCEQMSERRGVAIDFRHGSVPNDLPNDVALTLFRVLEEALGNAVRHAAVHRVSVWLGGSRGEIRLDVADEGVGFDPEAAMRGHGLGLIGMRERLSLVGGESQIDSQPSAGIRIRARVPLGRSD
jgi:signal transduction histidine kinase